MVHCSRLYIVLGRVPVSERALANRLKGSDYVWDNRSRGIFSHPEIECWTENLADTEIRDKLRAGILMYAAQNKEV